MYVFVGASIMCILARIYWSAALDFLTPFSTVSQVAHSHTAPSALIEFQHWGRAAPGSCLTYRDGISWKYFVFSNFLPVSCTLILHPVGRGNTSEKARKTAAFMLSEIEQIWSCLMRRQIARVTLRYPDILWQRTCCVTEELQGESVLL